MNSRIPHDRVQREARRLAGRKLGFLLHATVYLAVNALLLGIAWSSAGGGWVIFPALGWGIGLLAHALFVLGPLGRVHRWLVEREVRRIEAGRR